VDVLTARKDLGPEAYTDFALDWIESGATLVGGCCEVGPDHVRRLHDTLVDRGHSVTGF
jgi:homocysteine S-methyltransferase